MTKLKFLNNVFLLNMLHELTDFVIDNIEMKDGYIQLLENPEAMAFLDEYLSWKVYKEHNEHSRT